MAIVYKLRIENIDNNIYKKLQQIQNVIQQGNSSTFTPRVKPVFYSVECRDIIIL